MYETLKKVISVLRDTENAFKVTADKINAVFP